MAGESVSRAPHPAAPRGEATADAPKRTHQAKPDLDESRHSEFIAKAREIREQLQAALDELNTTVRAAEKTVGHDLAEAGEAIERNIAATEERISDNPIAAVLIAAGVGLLIGLLLNRGR